MKRKGLYLLLVIISCFFTFGAKSLAPGEKSSSEHISKNESIRRDTAHTYFKTFGWDLKSEEFNEPNYPAFLLESDWQKANEYSKVMGLTGAKMYDPQDFAFAKRKKKIDGYIEEYAICYFVQTAKNDPNKIVLAGIKVSIESADGLQIPELGRTWVFPANIDLQSIQKIVQQYFEKNIYRQPDDMDDGVFFGGIFLLEKDNKYYADFFSQLSTLPKRVDFRIVANYTMSEQKCKNLFKVLKESNQIPIQDDAKWSNTLGTNFYYTECLYTYKANGNGRKFYLAYCCIEYHSDTSKDENLVGWLAIKPVIHNEIIDADYFIVAPDTSLKDIANIVTNYFEG